MKKPDWWYGFRVFCELHEFGMSNMVQPEKQQWCKRKDRKGKERPRHTPLSCHWNVCPRLKANGKPNKRQNEIMKERN